MAFKNTTPLFVLPLKTYDTPYPWVKKASLHVPTHDIFIIPEDLTSKKKFVFDGKEEAKKRSKPVDNTTPEPDDYGEPDGAYVQRSRPKNEPTVFVIEKATSEQMLAKPKKANKMSVGRRGKLIYDYPDKGTEAKGTPRLRDLLRIRKKKSKKKDDEKD